MKFVSYATAATHSYGLLQDDGSVLDLPKAATQAGQSLPPTLAAFIAAGASPSTTPAPSNPRPKP